MASSRRDVALAPSLTRRSLPQRTAYDEQSIRESLRRAANRQARADGMSREDQQGVVVDLQITKARDCTPRAAVDPAVEQPHASTRELLRLLEGMIDEAQQIVAARVERDRPAVAN